LRMEGRLKEIAEGIRSIKRLAEGLLEKGSEMEAVKRNVKRVLATVRILELEVCDVVEVLGGSKRENG